MKQLFFVLPVAALVLAGCNAQQSHQTPSEAAQVAAGDPKQAVMEEVAEEQGRAQNGSGAPDVITIRDQGWKQGYWDIKAKTKSKELRTPHHTYVKPEGWVTLTSNQYGFRVDHPAEWHGDGGASNYSGARGGINISSLYGARLFFGVHQKKDGKRIPLTKDTVDVHLPRLDGNDVMVEKGGKAFEYFHGVASMDVDGDDFVVYTPPGSEGVKEFTDKGNFIRISIDPESPTHAKDLETLKTIILSFRRY